MQGALDDYDVMDMLNEMRRKLGQKLQQVAAPRLEAALVQYPFRKAARDPSAAILAQPLLADLDRSIADIKDLAVSPVTLIALLNLVLSYSRMFGCNSLSITDAKAVAANAGIMQSVYSQKLIMSCPDNWEASSHKCLAEHKGLILLTGVRSKRSCGPDPLLSRLPGFQLLCKAMYLASTLEFQ